MPKSKDYILSLRNDSSHEYQRELYDMLKDGFSGSLIDLLKASSRPAICADDFRDHLCQVMNILSLESKQIELITEMIKQHGGEGHYRMLKPQRIMYIE